MVDFSRFRRRSGEQGPTDPRAIFKRQPKPTGINDLWQSQREVLDAWVKRQDERELVAKLNTGGGKTLVGLLIAQALMNRHHRGALYLCADRQLVTQTVTKAQEFQLPAVAYAKGPLPGPFLNGQAILVASYHALFHGFSKFGTINRPLGGGDPYVQVSAVICDDAHTAFADLRDAFSIEVTRGKSPELYLELTGLFRPGFVDLERIGSYDHTVGGHDAGVFEVPYWTWRQHAPWVREKLARQAKGSEYEYAIPLLLDAFENCHVLVSTRAVTVTSLLPLVDRLPTFVEAPHRLYMSATIADDSALIRTFDADPKAVSTPIAPESLAGVGERMILAPALTPVGSADEMDLAKRVCVKAAKDGKGVVILTPSERRANRWEDIGTVVMGDAVATAVDSLVGGAGVDCGPYVFANRYDGIDLPGGACRVLVLDGMPMGANDYDVYRATALRGNSKIDLSLAQRVEQGLGRGTRGAGDYCVVLLLGDLVDWVGRRASADMLTGATRTQLDLGLDISKAIDSIRDFHATVDQCLKRNPDWVAHHAEQLAEKTVGVPTPTEAIEAAVLEREYLRLLQRGQVEQAAKLAERRGHEHMADRWFRGWVLQLAARAYDRVLRPDLARALQMEAFIANSHMLRPAGEISVRPLETLPQAKALAAVVDSYERRPVLQRKMAETLLPLSGKVPASQFEGAMRELGRYLGFGSFREDDGSGEGPDNAWVTDVNRVFVLSCKNEKGNTTPLHKKDLGQLLVDTEWVKTHYGTADVLSVVAQPSAKAAEKLPIEQVYVLTIDRLQQMVAALTTLYTALAESGLDIGGLEVRAADLLRDYDLTPDRIVKRYLQRFEIEVQPAIPRKGGSGSRAAKPSAPPKT